MSLLNVSKSNATIESVKNKQEINSEDSSKLSSVNLSNQEVIKLSLPKLHNLENSNEAFIKEIHEKNNKDLIINKELVEEYDKIKDSYKNIVNMIERSVENDRQLHDRQFNNLKHINIKDYKFEELEDFKNSVEQGEFNINDYSVSEINTLIRELDNLENKLIIKPLHSYNLKTINDFQTAINKGDLNLYNYKIEEINELLKELEDKHSLSSKDCNISSKNKYEVESIKTKDQGMIVDISEIEKESGLLFRLINKIKKHLNS